MPVVLPFVFAGVGLKTPTVRLDANFDALADWMTDHAASAGLLVDRPAPTAVGAIYIATDQGNRWYMADGAAWHPIGRIADGRINVDPATGVVSLFGAAAGTGAANVLTLASATGLPTGSPADLAQWYVTDTQGIAGRANWHQRSEDGWVNPRDRCLFRTAGNPAVTVSNTVVETDLVNVTVAPNTFQPGIGALTRTMEQYLALDVLNNSGATRTVTIRVKFGATTLFTTVISFLASGTRRRGTLGYRADALHGVKFVSVGLYEWDVIPAPTQAGPIPGGFPVDGTVAQPWVVTAQLSFASASFELRLFDAQLALL